MKKIRALWTVGMIAYAIAILFLASWTYDIVKDVDTYTSWEASIAWLCVVMFGGILGYIGRKYGMKVSYNWLFKKIFGASALGIEACTREELKQCVGLWLSDKAQALSAAFETLDMQRRRPLKEVHKTSCFSGHIIQLDDQAKRTYRLQDELWEAYDVALALNAVVSIGSRDYKKFITQN